jgi:hypothetical protein
VVNTLLKNTKSLDNYTYTSVFSSYSKLLNSDKTANVGALTLSNLSEAFFQAGATVFLGLLCERINNNPNSGYTRTVNPNTPVNPTLSSAADGPTLQDVIELTRYTISLVLGISLGAANVASVKSRLTQLRIPDSAFTTWGTQYVSIEGTDSTVEFKEISAINTLAKDALDYVLSVLGLISGGSIATDQVTVGVFDQETVQALITFGLGPWLVLSFVTLFEDASQSFVTQAYSRIAFYYMVMIAFTKLSALGSSSGTNQADLNTMISAINTLLTKSFTNIDNSGPISDILQLSNLNTSTAADLSTQSQSLKNRVGIASDLQTTLKFESKNVQYAKYTFYAWLVAFIIVFVTSVVLILTDRINVFLPLAYGILLLIVAAWILSWAVSWFRQRNPSDE